MKRVPEIGMVLKCEVTQAATNPGIIIRDDVRDYLKILLREKRLFRAPNHLARARVVLKFFFHARKRHERAVF